jgi:hypothetical protein
MAFGAGVLWKACTIKRKKLKIESSDGADHMMLRQVNPEIKL